MGFVMRILALFVLFSAPALADGRPVLTDPKKLESRVRPGVQPLSIEKLYMTRAIGSAAIGPDGKTLAFVSNLSGRRNIWTVASEGGWPTQLTISNDRQSELTWSPDGRAIAYIEDHDGDEQWDLYVVSPAGGEVVNLTRTRDISEEGPDWSPDGKQLVVSRKPRNGSSYELAIVDVATRNLRLVTSGTPKDRSYFAARWSPDGKTLAATYARANEKDSSVVLIDVANGRRTDLTPHEGEKVFGAAAWSPSGKQLLVSSNAGNGYMNVALLDVATRKLTWLTSDRWEMNVGAFSPDGKSVIWESNVDGNIDVLLYSLADRRARTLPLPVGENTLPAPEAIFTRDGRLLFFHEGPDAPRDVWTLPLKGGAARQITHSLVGGVHDDTMVEPFLVHYPSEDGRWPLSAFVYVPHNLSRDGRAPAVVFVHGGPTSQSTNYFNRPVQYFANQGYVVIAPNYRGSTGYGKAFMDANRYDMGGGDLSDVIGAADFVGQSGFVDSKKLVVMGGSYGGYMTMMAMTKAPERWAAGVAIVPFVNWFTEVQNEDPLLQQYDLTTMGDSIKNKALWEDRSPINFIDRIRAPLLLLAGGNDPRCPKSEAQQVYDSLKKRGGAVELKIYEDEGHSFSRVENQIDAWQRAAAFLRRYVPPVSSPASTR
jgi:dipeptidyl aminopeptidase/acylaminoacyl peptidase